MTRRRLYYFDKLSKKLYCTPEFNGDKKEFDLFSKRGDYCDKNFDEILKEFEGIKSLQEFENASNKAQSYYHSGLVGINILPIDEVEEITYNEEIYMLDNQGNPYLYNPEKLTREYILNMSNRGKFSYQNELPMNVIKKFNSELGYNVYELIIDPIKKVYSGQEVYLGDFENDDKNKHWGYEFNNNLNILIDKLESCKELQKKEPLKMKFVDLYYTQYKICLKDEEGNRYGFSDGGDCLFLTSIDKFGEPINRLYDFVEPILLDKKNIYAVFLDSHDGIGYEKKYFDIPRIEIAYKIYTYMADKKVEHFEPINQSLNDIYEIIYDVEKIEDQILKKYENENDIQKLKKEYYNFINNGMEISDDLEESEEEI